MMRLINKKWIGAGLSLVLLIGMLFASPDAAAFGRLPAPAYASAATSIYNLTVRPDILTISEQSQYQISFVTNVALTGGIDTVQIRFPSAFSFRNVSWASANALVNGTPDAGLDYYNGVLNVLIPRNQTIPAGWEVSINLLSWYMTNPSSAGEYTFSVSTSKETTPVTSNVFQISEFVNANGVSRAHVSFTPVRGYQSESITIRFLTNRGGQLIGGVDQVLIDFPTGVRLPSSIRNNSITINGVSMIDFDPTVIGQRLILPLSLTMNYPENYSVEIVIAANSGITVDRDASNVVARVYTTKNPALVDSFPFNLNKTPDNAYIPPDDKDPSVSVAPNGAGNPSQWSVTFPRNTILLMEGDTVMGFTLIFPSGVNLPTSIAPQCITVNGLASSGVLTTPARRELFFTLPVGIALYTDITIQIAVDAGIYNPPAAQYRMDVYPQRGRRTITTKTFERKSVADTQLQQQNPPQANTTRILSLNINDLVASRDGYAVVLDVAPQLIDSFTMVPLRFVSEGLGAAVVYDPAQNTVTLTLGAREVVLWPGSTLAKVDNTVVTLARAPILREGRTMVPIRFVAECFGAKVDFVSQAHPITITMSADALTRMPTPAEIQAAQAGAASGGAGGGAGNTGGTGGVSLIGRTVALKSGGGNANLRKGPSTDTERVGLLLPGETAKILEITGEWYRIEINASFTAWIRGDLVELR